MSKKIKIILIVFVALLLVYGGWRLYIDPTIICNLRGGQYFNHSFSSECELPAKDVGKNCIFDDECQKKTCIYPTSNTRPYSDAESKAGGKCDKYNGDDDGTYQCHRPNKGNELFGGDGNVKCDLWMS